MIITGTAHRLGRDVDTDVIIPARYLNTSDPNELAKHCLEDLDPTFVDRVSPGDIVVAEENFGCGSSREHAPVALKASGVGCVVAKSFARIFFRNAVNVGLPIVECPDAVDAIQNGHVVSVDTQAGTVTNVTLGEVYTTEPYADFLAQIIEAGGLVARTQQTMAAGDRTTADSTDKQAANGTFEGSSSSDLEASLPVGSSQPDSSRPRYNICLLPGDGIGPDVMREAVKVLRTVERLFDVEFVCEEHLIGGCAIEATKGLGPNNVTALPTSTLDAARTSDAVLLAAVGGPAWDDAQNGYPRPEDGLLGIRKQLDLYLNLRPVRTFEPLIGSSPLKPQLLKGVDVVIVRELTGGLYFGEHAREDVIIPGRVTPLSKAHDVMEYDEFEIERVVRRAFEIARERPRKLLHSIDKANVLTTSRLWREVVHRVALEYPDIECHDMLVDNCAMQLVRNPAQFDVIVTENTFGDILSDEASVLSASLGMLASGSFGDGVALYEPCHGSAPDIAGKGIANPLAQIQCVEMMLRHSLSLPQAANLVGKAIESVLDQGYRTADIAGPDTPETMITTTRQMGDKVVEEMARNR